MEKARQISKLPSESTDSNVVIEDLCHINDQDVNPPYNFGSFVNTHIDNDAKDILLRATAKNAACCKEYPSITELRHRCISVLAHLWRSSNPYSVRGAAASGSSEAIFLAIWALKLRWQLTQTQGSVYDAATPDPHIVAGSHAHSAITKGAIACGVAVRTIPVSVEHGYSIPPDVIRDYIDKDTIGVVLVLGNTYTGHVDLIDQISEVLAYFERQGGHRIPIHVDAASGGFVVPFMGMEGFRWDFSNPHVDSINASGHKFGLTLPAVGWVLWRDQSCQPQEMLTSSEYLYGVNESYTLSFSQPGGPVLLQYYNFARLGFAGYQNAVKSAFVKAHEFRHLINTTGWFQDVESLRSQTTGQRVSSTAGLPVVAFAIRKAVKRRNKIINEVNLSKVLMRKGFSVPSCVLETTGGKISLLRVVARKEVTAEILRELFEEIVRICTDVWELEKLGELGHLPVEHP